jgi:hypothetical protein
VESHHPDADALKRGAPAPKGEAQRDDRCPPRSLARLREDSPVMVRRNGNYGSERGARGLLRGYRRWPRHVGAARADVP